MKLISTIKNAIKKPKIPGMSNLIKLIKRNLYKKSFHTRAIPYHSVPFDDQVRETQAAVSDLAVEIKTRQKVVNKLLSRLENAGSKQSKTGAKPAKINKEAGGR